MDPPGARNWGQSGSCAAAKAGLGPHCGPPWASRQLSCIMLLALIFALALSCQAEAVDRDMLWAEQLQRAINVTRDTSWYQVDPPPATAAQQVCGKEAEMPGSTFARTALLFQTIPSGIVARMGLHSSSYRRLLLNCSTPYGAGDCLQLPSPADVLMHATLAIRSTWIAFRVHRSTESACSVEAEDLHHGLVRGALQTKSLESEYEGGWVAGEDEDMHQFLMVNWNSTARKLLTSRFADHPAVVALGEAARAVETFTSGRQGGRCATLIRRIAKETCVEAMDHQGTMIKLNVSEPVRKNRAPHWTELPNNNVVPTSGLGTAGVGTGERTHDQWVEMLASAIALGVRLFDTGQLYDEESKREGLVGTDLIGKAIKLAIQRGHIEGADEIHVTTKIGLEPLIGERLGQRWRSIGMGRNAMAELSAQAQRLGIDHFTTVGVHHPHDYNDKELANTFQQLVSRPDVVKGIQLSGTHGYGLVFDVGPSGGRYAHPFQVRSQMKLLNKAKAEVVSMQLTVGLFMDAWAWRGLSIEEYAKRANIKVMAIELHVTQTAKKCQHAAKPILKDLMGRTQAPSLSSLLISYAVHNGMVPIVGSSKLDHIKANIQAARSPQQSDHFEALRALRGLVLPCRMDLEGAGWRDVFGLDAYFQSKRYQDLLQEFPGVCPDKKKMTKKRKAIKKKPSMKQAHDASDPDPSLDPGPNCEVLAAAWDCEQQGVEACKAADEIFIRGCHTLNWIVTLILSLALLSGCSSRSAMAGQYNSCKPCQACVKAHQTCNLKPKPCLAHDPQQKCPTLTLTLAMNCEGTPGSARWFRARPLRAAEAREI